MPLGIPNSKMGRPSISPMSASSPKPAKASGARSAASCSGTIGFCNSTSSTTTPRCTRPWPGPSHPKNHTERRSRLASQPLPCRVTSTGVEFLTTATVKCRSQMYLAPAVQTSTRQEVDTAGNGRFQQPTTTISITVSLPRGGVVVTLRTMVMLTTREAGGVPTEQTSGP